MRKMICMTAPPWDDHLQVRTTALPKLAIDKVAAELRATALRFWGRRVTKEAVLNAVLLWLEDLGAETLEEGLAGPLQRLEEILGWEPPASAKAPKKGPPKPTAPPLAPGVSWDVTDPDHPRQLASGGRAKRRKKRG